MVKEIRIYIEGGGDKKDTKKAIRIGFSEFLKDIKQIAQKKRIRWQVIICGSRQNAFEDFNNALKANPNAFNVLLVDAEAPVYTTPCQHLKRRDNWDLPNIDDEHCHLMVQTMEAWLIADIETLKKFYGQGFKAHSIPSNPNVEEIEKKQLEPSLKAATRHTQKGEYHKIQHASKLLALLDVDKVRQASPHCNRLFTTLIHKM
ncbi:MAG: hypothetical protein DRR16_18005 [Candidatus Parabeggiatoa sp. nov. 3]|nr:MAG: hypothetical protein DRR00_27485 [Gammaproteobacteria bacterium]RKZ58497.1 MAG: hypothetical protein DRQ99_25355 [Gammaproteobacteria bacterium]RKZ83153.1 MAG: hypothetical protein DRR16_18005 [Gammaproteobacteria bacterium]